ncbi:MAG: hypothetical protein QM640_08065 [Niabella sp.]
MAIAVLFKKMGAAEGIHRFYILISYFLWFLPVLNVRFSSETWSGLFFLFSIGVIKLPFKKKILQFGLAGVLAGVSFLCRFQSAILISTFIFWLIFQNKNCIKDIFIFIISIFPIILIGVIIDSWFYGNIVFTPWNYFYSNIVLNTASHFGISPWYYYLVIIITKPILVIGVLIILCIFIVTYQRPKSLLVWLLIPFLVIHSLIPHKEDRFLFPVINFLPLIIVLGWQELKTIFKAQRNNVFFRFLISFFIGTLLVINTFGLLIMAFKPMGNGVKVLTQYIYRNYHNKPVILIYDQETKLYSPFINLKERSYEDKNVIEIPFQYFILHSNSSIIKDSSLLFVFEKAKIHYPDYAQVIQRFSLKPKIQSIPQWIESLGKYYSASNDIDALVLYGSQ